MKTNSMIFILLKDIAIYKKRELTMTQIIVYLRLFSISCTCIVFFFSSSKLSVPRKS